MAHFQLFIKHFKKQLRNHYNTNKQNEKSRRKKNEKVTTD